MCSNDRRFNLILFFTVFPLAAASVAYPFIIGFPDVYMELDMSMMELYTRNAVQGNQFVGMYSRFGWNHPGPAFFYLLAPFYMLTGERSSSIFWAALVINTAAVLLFSLGLRKIAKQDLILAVSLSLSAALFVLRIGIDHLASPWNPGAIVLPFLLFMLICAVFCTGGVLYLPAIMILGSLLIQMHIGIGPAVTAIIVISCVFYVVWNRSERHREKYCIAAAVAATVIMWILPVAEEMAGRPGNLSKITAFFLQTFRSASWSDAIYAVAIELTWFPLFLLKKAGLSIPDFEYELLAVVITVVVQTGIVVITVAAIKNGSMLRANLGLIQTLAVFTALWSTLRIQGDIFGYLTFWISAIGCIGWALVLAEIGSRLSQRTSRKFPLAWILISIFSLLVAAVSTFSFLRLPVPFDSQKIRLLSQGLITYLQEERITRPVFLFNWSSWSTDAPLILQLRKKRIIFATQNVSEQYGKDWPLLLGPAYRPLDGDFYSVSVVSQSSANGRQGDVAARFGDTLLCVKNSAGSTDVSRRR